MNLRGDVTPAIKDDEVPHTNLSPCCKPAIGRDIIMRLSVVKPCGFCRGEFLNGESSPHCARLSTDRV